MYMYIFVGTYIATVSHLTVKLWKFYEKSTVCVSNFQDFEMTV